MKKLFTTAPILSVFDPEKTTIVETDSSGWCVGGTLLQEGDDGLLRPCAYFSKKNNPAECNYEIYDKEMLAIVRCLQEWDAELRSVDKFQIKTDHKNLEYFMTVQKLTECQMRWSLILSRYNFTICYVPGKINIRADALSRREQDMPADASDDRLQYRRVQLLPPERFQPLRVSATSRARQEWKEADSLSQTAGSESPAAPNDQSIETAWEAAEEEDVIYQGMVDAIRKDQRIFPSKLGVKVSIAECSLSTDGKLHFRGRR